MATKCSEKLKAGECTMNCSQCGKPLEQGAKFCQACGAPVPELVEPNNDAGAGEQQADAAANMPDDERIADLRAKRQQQKASAHRHDAADIPVLDPASYQPPAPPKRKLRVGRIIAGVIVLALLGSGVAAGVYYGMNWYQENEQQKADAAAHEPIPFKVELKIDGYSQGSDTPVAVHVEGTDLDGTAVSQDVCVTDDEPDQLLRGDYVISAIASPILADGTMFAVPTDTYDVRISKQEVDPIASFDFGEPLEAANILESDIEKSVEMAVSCGMNRQNATVLGNRVKKLRDAARTKAQSKQTKKDNLVTCGFVEFYLPSAWWGSVTWDTRSVSTGSTGAEQDQVTEAFVKLNGTDLVLLRVLSVPSEALLRGVDLDGFARVKTWLQGDDNVYLYANTGCAKQAARASSRISGQNYAQAVALLTGGDVSVEEALNMSSGEIKACRQSIKDYVSSKIASKATIAKEASEDEEDDAAADDEGE